MFSRNQVFCLKIWKLWRAPTTLQFNIFCWNFVHVSYLPMSTKEGEGFILFWLDLELFAKIKKTCFLHTRFLYFYNSRLSKIQVKIINICFISMYETFKSSRSQGVEAAFCRCFSKYVFFKIPQYSQQNIYVGVRPANLLKSDFNTGVFLWILRNF